MNKIVHNPFPNLSTERLFLRRLSAEDDSEIFAIRSNEEMVKYLDRPLSKAVEETRDFIKKINASIDNNESVYWAVTLKNNPKLIGTICLWNFSDDKSQAEVGFELLPEYQGKGIMNEALTAVINYGFSVLALHSLLGEVDPKNLRSIKLMERHSFKLTAPTYGKGTDAENNSGTVVYELTNSQI